MIWAVQFSREARKRLMMLPRNERERILRSVDRLLYSPYQSGLDVKKLKGCDEWRLRVGKWRVVFEIYDAIVTIHVVTVDTRGDAYK